MKCLECLFIETTGLPTGIVSHGPVTGEYEVMVRFFMVVALGIMMGDYLNELVQFLLVNAFQGAPDIFMDFSSFPAEQAVVSNLLCHGVFEYVCQFREKAVLIDEFQALQCKQGGFEFLLHVHNGMQDAIGKIPANYRGHLHGPLDVVFQPVHTCGNNALNRVRDINMGDV